MKKNDCDIELLAKYLKGRFLTSFSFDNFFTLNFHTYDEDRNGLPNDVELTIMSHWWFGAKEEWDHKVLNYGKGVQPDEPVLSYELALLRWSDDSQIVKVERVEDTIRIEFKNKKYLNLSLVFDDENDEYVYILGEGKSENIIFACP